MSMSFDEANKVVHPVETEWHYPILTEAGFVPETKKAVGFVRSYVYNHPDGRSVRCSTGVNADYWSSSDGKGGYWNELKTYAKPLTSTEG